MDQEFLQEIGRLSILAHEADVERKNAKKARAKAFEEHGSCSGTNAPYDMDRGGACFHNVTEEEYCDSCKITQPFHKKFIESAQKSRSAKCRLVIAIKNGNALREIKNGVHNPPAKG